MSIFCPIQTGTSFFDVWSVIHAAFWLAVGVFFGVGGVPQPIGWVTIIVLAYVWEVLERVFFYRFVKHKEVWFNSFVSDPLMTVGAAFGYCLTAKSSLAMAVGLLASWVVVGGNLQALKASRIVVVFVSLLGAAVWLLVRALWLSTAPWYVVFVVEPLMVVGIPVGYWLISKQ